LEEAFMTDYVLKAEPGIFGLKGGAVGTNPTPKPDAPAADPKPTEPATSPQPKD
jgi:hypothetical protein